MLCSVVLTILTQHSIWIFTTVKTSNLTSDYFMFIFQKCEQDMYIQNFLATLQFLIPLLAHIIFSLYYAICTCSTIIKYHYIVMYYIVGK